MKIEVEKFIGKLRQQILDNLNDLTFDVDYYPPIKNVQLHATNVELLLDESNVKIDYTLYATLDGEDKPRKLLAREH